MARKRKASDLKPGAAPEQVPGQIELFSLDMPEAPVEQQTAPVVPISATCEKPSTTTEGNQAA